jgi:hypothetical protein
MVGCLNALILLANPIGEFRHQIGTSAFDIGIALGSADLRLAGLALADSIWSSPTLMDLRTTVGLIPAPTLYFNSRL